MLDDGKKSVCLHTYASSSLTHLYIHTIGAESFGMTILIGLSKMIFTLIAVLYSDHAGRRPLLLISTCGLAVCLFLMAVVVPYPSLSGLMVFAMCAYMGVFSMAMGKKKNNMYVLIMALFLFMC